MIHVTTSIYELEIKIRDISFNDEVISAIIEADLLSVLNKDISIIITISPIFAIVSINIFMVG